MRFWFDTEFYENGRTIDLISIGVVCEDGSEFYAEVEGFDFDNTDQWLVENVKPYLTGATIPKEKIAGNLYKFITARTTTPQFWAYYADYDWVVFCQLFGRMIDLPDGFPMYCNDVKQEMERLGLSSSHFNVVNEMEHNALADARWTRDVHVLLEKEYKT